MSSSGVQGADPDALAVLAMWLDKVAADISQELTQLRLVTDGLAALPAAGRLAEVVTWCETAATTARRTALLVLSDGRDWREHRGLFGNVWSVARAEMHGVVEGTMGMGRGAVNLVATAAANAVEPQRLAWALGRDGIDGFEDELADSFERRRRMVKGLCTSLVDSVDATSPVSYAVGVRDDGFWRATRERAEAVGEQMPSVALTVATSGAGATAAVGAEMSAGAKVGAALGAAAKSAVGPGNF